MSAPLHATTRCPLGDNAVATPPAINATRPLPSPLLCSALLPLISFAVKPLLTPTPLHPFSPEPSRAPPCAQAHPATPWPPPLPRSSLGMAPAGAGAGLAKIRPQANPREWKKPVREQNRGCISAPAPADFGRVSGARGSNNRYNKNIQIHQFKQSNNTFL